MAPYKTPLHWIFVDRDPLTPSGKIQKFKLREQFAREALICCRARRVSAAAGAPDGCRNILIEMHVDN